jgi:hypothetical protein
MGEKIPVIDLELGSGIDISELEKGLSDAEQAVIKSAAKQFEAIEKSAQEQTAVIRKKEAEEIAIIKKSTDDHIAAIKARNDLSGGDKRKEIQAIKDAEAAKIKAVKEGTKLQEAAVKTTAAAITKTVQDSAKKQLKAVKDGYKSAGQAVKDFAKGAVGSLMGMDQMLASIAGGPVAIGKLVADMAKKAIAELNEMAESWRQQEVAEVALQNAAKNNPYLNDRNVKQLKTFADEMQRNTGIDNVVIMQTETRLASLGRNQSQMQKIIKTAADMAAQGIMDFDSAVMELNNSYNGVIRTSGRLYPELKNLSKEAFASGEALDIIAKKVGGSAAEAMRTGAGSVTAYKNAWGDLKKFLGEGWEEVTRLGRNLTTDLLNKINETLAKRKQLAEAEAALKPGAGNEQRIREEEANLKKLNDQLIKYQKEITNISDAEKRGHEDAIARTRARIEATEKEINNLKTGVNTDVDAVLTATEAKIESLGDKMSVTMDAVFNNLTDKSKLWQVGWGVRAVSLYNDIKNAHVSAADEIIEKEEYRIELMGESAEKIRGEQKDYSEAIERLRRQEEANHKKVIEEIKERIIFEGQVIDGIEQRRLLATAERDFEQHLLDTAKRELQTTEERISNEKDARKEIQDSLEKELEIIRQKARIEGKSLRSADVQKQILNARINAYTNLIGKIGAAGEAEKRMLAELQAEYARQERETADKLQEDNLKKLETQKKEIMIKAELEGRATDSIKTRAEILDAEVNAYNNQLKIIRDLIDGTKEHETERRRALETQWREYAQEVQTREAQKTRLNEMIKLQDEVNRKVRQMYDAALVTIDKNEYEKGLRDLMLLRRDVERNTEKISGDERLKELTEINKKITDHKIAYLTKEKDARLAALDEEMEKLREMAEIEAGEAAVNAARERGAAESSAAEAANRSVTAQNALAEAAARSNRLAAAAAAAAREKEEAERRATAAANDYETAVSQHYNARERELFRLRKIEAENALERLTQENDAAQAAAARAAQDRERAAEANRKAQEGRETATQAVAAEEEKRVAAVIAGETELNRKLEELSEERKTILKANAIETTNITAEAYREMIDGISGRGAISQIKNLKDVYVTEMEAMEDAHGDSKRRIEKIEEHSAERIKEIRRKSLEDFAAGMEKCVNLAQQMADGISSIQRNLAEYELNENLRKNDALEQSDEERAANKERLEKEAAIARYKADMNAYAANCLLSAAQGALMAIRGFLDGGWPGFAAAMATALVQQAVITSAEPKRPRFHEGGVVQGRSGQEVSAVLRAKEVVSTPGQFNNTMQAIANLAEMRGGGGATVVQPQIEINNTVSDTVTATARYDPEGVVIDIVNKAFAEGKLDRGVAGQRQRSRGAEYV